MNSGVRVSIPNSVRKTIQNIKEITGNHSEDEIYAMLKDCSMDPNETAQKLLLQDPFHEVRRKRDRKKEIPNKESTEPRWKPGMQGWGNRGGRGNYSSRHLSHDAGSSRNAVSGKENKVVADSSSDIVSGKISTAPDPHLSAISDANQSEVAALGDGNAQGHKLLSESSRPASRPPSNYNNRPHQPTGPQKVGPAKEWKPKPANPIPAQGSGNCDSKEMPTSPASDVLDSKDATSEKELHISDGQHVIIPDHLHVPEVEKLGFRFGSFDASFGINSSSIEKSPSLSEASEGINEHIEEQTSRNQDVLVTSDDGDYPNVPENLAAEGDMAHDHSESNQETSHPAAGHQHPVVHASANLSFGFVPPIIGSRLPPIESSESQAREASRAPSFVVQPSFDPASYYPQFYRSGADGDGRVSPFHPPGVAMLSSQASQSEIGSSLVLSAAGPTPLATQAPLPVFRQPTGLHLPHFPSNYIPYGPYFSPFYIPPPAIHQFLSNGAFPQQPQGGSVYPAPKYPLAQYKPGSNIGNPGTYGPYGSSPAGYNPNPASTAGNSTSNEEFGGPQFKERNVYVTGQQSEGSGVWIAAPGRDISGLQAPFYNLPQGGQVAYTPTQAAHGTFASIYHPAQPVTTGPVHPLLQPPQTMAGGVDMVGPTSSVYQQPPLPPAQINWPNNY